MSHVELESDGDMSIVSYDETTDEVEHVINDEPREMPENVANGAVVPVARAQFHRLNWCHMMLLMMALVNVVTGQMKFDTTFSSKHPVLYTESRRYVPERDVFATFIVRLSHPCQWIPRDSEDAETIYERCKVVHSELRNGTVIATRSKRSCLINLDERAECQ